MVPTSQNKKKLANIGEGHPDLTTEANTLKGTLIEEGIDNKVYMIKSSGTIVDISKKKRKKN